MRLTDSGGAFLPVARDLEYRFRQADSFCQKRGEPPRLLRLGIIRTVSNRLLQAVVGLLTQLYEIELTEGSDYNLRADMAGNSLDAALTVLRGEERGFDARPIFEEPYTTFAAERHRLAGSVNVPPAELASETMIARRACEALSSTSRFFTRNGVRPRFSFKSDNDERCLHMVAAGIGVTTAPMSLMIDGLNTIGVAGYDLKRRIGLLINTKVMPNQDLCKFLDSHIDELASYS